MRYLYVLAKVYTENNNKEYKLKLDTKKCCRLTTHKLRHFLFFHTFIIREVNSPKLPVKSFTMFYYPFPININTAAPDSTYANFQWIIGVIIYVFKRIRLKAHLTICYNTTGSCKYRKTSRYCKEEKLVKQFDSTLFEKLYPRYIIQYIYSYIPLYIYIYILRNL